MSTINLSEITNFTKKKQYKFLLNTNNILQKMSTEQRIIWGLKNLPKSFVLSSSFGIQSSVLLHLLTKYKSNIPIIFIDTGYLFSETYRFIDMLTAKLQLNLHIFRAHISPAWQEVRYGKLWEQGIQGIDFYNKINKIEPMKFALKKLSVQTWCAGLRYQQSRSRSHLSFIDIQNHIFKFLPILDWTQDQIHYYIKKNQLDYHPLWNKGYLSVGDIHTTKPYQLGMKEEDTRFFGLKRECGLHEI